MSKKVKLYILIIVNLLVWGYVGYKVYSALQGEDHNMFEYETPRINKINDVLHEDSVTLILNYADPFLKNGDNSKTKIVSNNNHTSAKTNSVSINSSKPTVNIPLSIDIKYLGLIKNTDKGTLTALISLNGKSFFAKQNEVIDEIIVKEITNDNITILNGKEKIIVKKQ